MSPPSATVPETLSPQAKLLSRWFEAFSTKNIDILREILDDDNYTHQVLPKTTGWKPLNKAEFIAEVANMLSLVSELHVRLFSSLRVFMFGSSQDASVGQRT